MNDQKTALITGASSGIGAEFARELAAKGYNLIIHGRRRELLEELAKEISGKYAVSVRIEIAELASRAELDRLTKIVEQTENLEMLVNNAGYTTRENFHIEDLQGQINLLNVHLTATLALTHAAIPNMLRHGKGYIINVASVAGFFAAPRSALYCSTKAFLNTFSEALHLELKDTPIKVQALCPGFTLSDFHKKLGYDPKDPCFKKFMTAQFIVSQSLKDLEKNKVYSIPGAKYKFIVLMSKWLPKRFIHFMTVKYYSRRRAAKVGTK
jgi:short-subunit dehydrogenase